MIRARKIPCVECRLHRRRCTPTSSNKCSRCDRLRRECLEQPKPKENKFYSDLELIEGKKIQQQIFDLEQTIYQLETQLKTQSCRAIQNHNHSMREMMITNLEHSWKLQINDGTFQVETGIKNISDLLFIQSNEIPYLSPISCYSGASSSTDDEIETKLLMHFSSKSFDGLTPFLTKTLAKYANQKLKLQYSDYLPDYLLLQPTMVVDHLVSTYFICYNLLSPIVHENSFMERYLMLENPLDDLITLCICNRVCGSPCNHIHFTSHDRRAMADYFFEKARNMILDQFDVPGKRLENVMSINILGRYMHANFKHKEGDELIAIAYQICLDLANEFKDPPQNPSYKYQVDHALFTRHITITMSLRGLLNGLFDRPMDESSNFNSKWVTVDDEPEETKTVIETQNWFWNLFSHSYIQQFMLNIYRAQTGKEYALSFECIVQFEGVIASSVSTIPSKFRLCDDFKDTQKCIEAINRTTDRIKLLVFIHFQMFIVGAFSYLIQPVASYEGYDLLCSRVQQRSLENTLDGCRLLIHATRHLSKMEETKSLYITAATDLLFGSVDALLLLLMAHDQHIAKESQFALRACLEDIGRINHLQIDQLPVESSPIVSAHKNFIDTNSFDFKYYNRYPQPWYALMYDITKYMAGIE
ncbi:hypothetical protein MFLAVUS_011327 [Mucor flavus]|uniref:Zn(2)-C6 fungal-type domain-containing protein n=1 Tax=Mucor flavus TaxID=439312 RepID=A0ABP9ZF86_9FUNG